MQVSNKINPDLLKNIKNLPVEEQSRVLDLLKDLKETEDKEAAREGFMPFNKKVWPAFIEADITRSWQKPLNVLPTVISKD